MCRCFFAWHTSVDYRLQIVTAAGGARKIYDTISILEDGRTQAYMQESISLIGYVCMMEPALYRPDSLIALW
jgi:hypothetical protein